jgi:hypothetical protein
MFTIQNLGGEVRDRSAAGIDRAFYQCREDHGAEGLDIGEEYRDWYCLLRDGDAATISMWEKERPTIKNLPTVFLGVMKDNT